MGPPPITDFLRSLECDIQIAGHAIFEVLVFKISRRPSPPLGLFQVVRVRALVLNNAPPPL